MAEVLVAGATGGREQALAQAMEMSPEVTRVVVSGDIQAGLDQFSGGEKPFVVIGPEAPLVKGVADGLREDGYVVFGAGSKAAQYEASKARTVQLSRLYGVRHPETTIAQGPELAKTARDYVTFHRPNGYVIKADGLAGGKGVVVPESKAEARDAIEDMLSGGYDGAGAEVINFQSRRRGPEASAMVVVGGEGDFTILPLSQDHKRLQDGDRGPNTGGMGAYSPVPDSIVSQEQYGKIEEMAERLLYGMKKDSVQYMGAVMYLGLMMDEELNGDPTLIEINVRFGDPETQAILPIAQRAGVDVYRLLRSAAEGQLEKPAVDFRNVGGAALTVCLAAGGYGHPNSTIQKGEHIYGLDTQHDGVSVQLAGAKQEDGHVRTNGGRVLYVTAAGETIDEAATRAYAAIDTNGTGQGIGFAGMQFRTDIGYQARSAA